MKESAEIKALDQLHVKGAARGQSGLSVRGGLQFERVGRGAAELEL